MKLSNAEKRIIKDLFGSTEGLLLFTLYSRLNISPAELFKMVGKLTSNGLITEKHERVTLTDDGKKYAIGHNILPKKQGTIFDNIPDEFIGPKIQVNEFYLPNVDALAGET